MSCEVAEVSWVVDSSSENANPVHPIDVLLGLNPANGQAKVISCRCDDEETPNTCHVWSSIALLKN